MTKRVLNKMVRPTGGNSAHISRRGFTVRPTGRVNTRAGGTETKVMMTGCRTDYHRFVSGLVTRVQQAMTVRRSFHFRPTLHYYR